MYSKPSPRTRGRKSYRRGRFFEQLVALGYRIRGWAIIRQRWRNPHCEIDLIVASRRQLRCIEVKYRSDSDAIIDLFPAIMQKRLWKAAQLAHTRFSRDDRQECNVRVIIFGPSFWQWRCYNLSALDFES